MDPDAIIALADDIEEALTSLANINRLSQQGRDTLSSAIDWLRDLADEMETAEDEEESES
jgi:hypothetical protein